MPGAGSVRAGRAYVEFFGEDSKLQRTLKSTEKSLNKWGKNISVIGASILGVGSAILGPLAGAAKAFSDMGSDLKDVSDRTGASVEALSSLAYAADQSGSSMEDLETGIKKSQKAIAAAVGGSKEAADSFSMLGLNVQQLAQMKPETQFRTIARAIAAIQNPTAKAAAAMAIFGKSGTMLLPMIGELDALEARARELGIVMSTEDAKSAHALGDAWTDLVAVGKALVFQVGAALAPILTDLVLRAADAASAFIGWIRANRETIVTIAKVAAGIALFGAGLVVVGGLISGFGAALGVIATIASGVAAVIGALAGAVAFLISPIGLVIAGLTAGVVAFVTYSEAGQQALQFVIDVFGELKDHALATFGGIKDALAAGDIALAGKVLWTSLRVVWLEGTTFLRQKWFDFLDAMVPRLIQVAHKISDVFIDMAFSVARSLLDLDELLEKQFGIKGLGADKRNVAKNAIPMVSAGFKQAARNRITDTGKGAVAEADTSLEQSKADLEKAQADFAAARTEAEKAAAQVAINKAREKIKTPELPDLAPALDLAKTAVVGTFSGAAASGLGSGGKVEEIADNTAMSNKLLKTIASKPIGFGFT